MATISSRATPPTRITTLAGIRVSIWAALISSRLLILAVGIAGASLTRAGGWRLYDPHGLTLSLGRVGNVIAAASDRWDAVHYVSIAHHGYTTGASTVFFPLYPLLIRIIGSVVPSYVLAGVLISCVSFVVALILLHRLAREELGERAADATVLLLALAPLSFFFTAVYTESLFLALSVGAFYLARHQRFALASLAAAGAALTHVEGVVLMLPLALFYWQSRNHSRRIRDLISWEAVSLTLPALALLGFLTYLHSRGFGWLAPTSNEKDAAYSHDFTGPVITLVRAVSEGLSGLWQTVRGTRPINPWIGSPYSMGFQTTVYLIVLGICLASLVVAWRRLPKVYSIYTIVVLIIATSSPVRTDALHAIDRYALMLFPLWMAAGAWLSERRLLRPVLEVSTVLLAFYAFEFARWVFVA
jgi:Mannosyltransferase (PIG-V)